MHNKFLVPTGNKYDSDFLNHEFIPIMLRDLGLDDESGVIYEILEHDYFELEELGNWDLMVEGMTNVRRDFW